MKIRTVLNLLFMASLFYACHDDDPAGPAEPLEAKIDGVKLNLSDIQTELVQSPKFDLVKISGTIDGNLNNSLIIYVAYKDLPGSVVDLSTDEGHAFINYFVNNGDMYGAGEGFQGTSGEMKITKNHLTARKIEGEFSGTLLNLNNTSQTISCTNGRFSVTY